MSKERQSYLLQDEKQQERLKALAEAPNSLEDERILCKFLCEQAANAGHAGLAAMIAQTIAKISRTEIQNQVATGGLIGRDEVIAMLRVITQAVADEIQDRFVGWEDALLNISSRFDATMKNTPLQLEYQR